MWRSDHLQYWYLVYLSSIRSHESIKCIFYVKEKTRLRAITKFMLIIFQIQCHQLLQFFYYSFVLDNHHLSTDNIKRMHEQVIIAKLRRGMTGIELLLMINAIDYNTISKYFTI